MAEKEKIKIIILDTGLDPLSPVARNMNFKGGLEFYLDNEGIITLNDSVDDIGHGTAVAVKLFQ